MLLCVITEVITAQKPIVSDILSGVITVPELFYSMSSILHDESVGFGVFVCRGRGGGGVLQSRFLKGSCSYHHTVPLSEMWGDGRSDAHRHSEPHALE